MPMPLLRGRSRSPRSWLGNESNESDDLDDASDTENDGSPFARGLKKLLNGVTNPNQPDPTNPVINGVASTKHSRWRNTMADLLSQIPRAGENSELITQLLNTEIFNGGEVDDRSYQMEKIIEFVASLPVDSDLQNQLSGTFIKALWDNLEHPPLSKLDNEYRYRKADGSNNNLMYPHLGKAGSAYTRTVTPKTLQPGILPDPGVIFDALFARGDEPQEHPNRISSMLFHFASIIIHDIFHTDERDPTKVKTSSYLDLAPLYGSSEEELSKIRTFKDGLLKPDCFCEGRILGFPPAVAALLICFNRYHNYVAIQLKEINEKGRFDDPEDPNDEAGLKKLDNDLFQTARLVTCGLYVNVILIDYVRTILNLNREETTWTLDPRKTFDKYFSAEGAPVGIGNQVSVEFNLIYRWHSAISVNDEKWTNEAYEIIFPEQTASDLNERDFRKGLHDWFKTQGADPSHWNIDLGRVKRNERGRFRDEDLAYIMAIATDDVACAFGPRQVPIAMKVVEMMAIKQARSWNVATLNEFRRFFKLKPYKSFSEVTSNKEVAQALKALYKYPDYIELYPGLIAEDAKEAGDASGLCPGFTVSRTILADAVALVRGDRFYTIDYTPANLTNWGFNQIQPDATVAQGHCIYNLLMRALPNWYRGNSVYAMFPFVTSHENERILKHLQKANVYSFDWPAFKPVPPSTKSWYAAVQVLKNPGTFKVPWNDHIVKLIGGEYPFMLGVDNEQGLCQRKEVSNAMYCPVDGLNQVREFYEALTTQLIQIRSDKLYGQVRQLDACRDVINPSHAIYVARLFHIPLKGRGDMGIGVEVDSLGLALCVAFAYVFLDADTGRSFKLKNAAKDACDKLSELLKLVVTKIKAGKELRISKLFEMGSQGETLAEYGKRLIERLLEDGKSVDEVVSIIIPTAAGGVATQSQAFTSILDVYLSEPYKKHWPKIQELAQSDHPDDFEKLKMYALEAARLQPAAYGVLRAAAEDCNVHDGEEEIQVQKGSALYINFVTAGLDERKFPNPREIDITRDPSLYIHQGWGTHSCLGRRMTDVSMAAQLRVFARLKNLRRAPGPQGAIKYTYPRPNPVSSDPVPGLTGIKVFMKEDWSDWWPFPTTLKLHHDGFMTNEDYQLSQLTGLPHRSTDLKEAMEANSISKENNPEIRLNGRPDRAMNGGQDDGDDEAGDTYRSGADRGFSNGHR